MTQKRVRSPRAAGNIFRPVFGMFNGRKYPGTVDIPAQEKKKFGIYIMDTQHGMEIASRMTKEFGVELISENSYKGDDADALVINMQNGRMYIHFAFLPEEFRQSVDVDVLIPLPGESRTRTDYENIIVGKYAACINQLSPEDIIINKRSKKIRL